jgi:uncharacterized protein (TIGR02118 family)
MIKFVAIVWRKEDLSEQEFTDYWRGQHGPLVARHADALNIKRYIQNHRIPSEIIDDALASRGWLPPPDGMAEMTWDSLETMQRAITSPAGMRANAELAEDEANFCAMKKMSAFIAEENIVVDRI